MRTWKIAFVGTAIAVLVIAFVGLQRGGMLTSGTAAAQEALEGHAEPAE